MNIFNRIFGYIRTVVFKVKHHPTPEHIKHWYETGEYNSDLLKLNDEQHSPCSDGFCFITQQEPQKIDFPKIEIKQVVEPHKELSEEEKALIVDKYYRKVRPELYRGK